MNELKEFGFIVYTKHQNGKGTYFSPVAGMSLSYYTDSSKEWGLSYVFLCDIILNDTKIPNVEYSYKNGTFASPTDNSKTTIKMLNSEKDSPEI